MSGEGEQQGLKGFQEVLPVFQNYKHDIEDCIFLKREIESLIRRGYLYSYVNQPNTLEAVGQELQPITELPLKNRILVGTISGGLAT